MFAIILATATATGSAFAVTLAAVVWLIPAPSLVRAIETIRRTLDAERVRIDGLWSMASRIKGLDDEVAATQDEIIDVRETLRRELAKERARIDRLWELAEVREGAGK